MPAPPSGRPARPRPPQPPSPWPNHYYPCDVPEIPSSRIVPGRRYSSPMAANPRHPKGLEINGSAAEILMQQAEQQMVLPDAIDAEIAPRQPLAGEAAFLQHPDRRRIGGDAGGLDAVEIELAEQRRQQYAQRRRHVAAMRMRLSDPVPDGAGLHDAAADVRQRDAADHRAIRFAKHHERIGSVGGDVFGIATQPPPEAGAAQIVRWPDRLPRRQVFPAGFAQMRPLQKIGHLRRAQQKAMATRGKRGRPAGWQTKQGHVQYSLMPKPAS